MGAWLVWPLSLTEVGVHGALARSSFLVGQGGLN